MIEKIRTYFQSRKMDPALRQDFIRELYLVNFNRARIFTSVLLVLFAFMVLVDVLNKSKGMWEKPGYHGLFYVHAATALALFICTPLYFLRRPAGKSDIGIYHIITVNALAFILMVSGVATSLVDQLIHGQISAYVITAFGIGAALLMRNVMSAVIYATGIALFMAGIGQVQKDPGQLMGHYINGTSLSVVAWILSRVVYAGFKSNFLHRKTIEEQQVSIIRQSEINTELVHSLADVSSRLNDSFTKLETHSGNLSTNLQNQAASLEEMTATTEEVSAGAENVRESVLGQAESINRLIQKIDELSSVTADMERKMTQALERAGTIADKAKAGEGHISSMNMAMNEISGTSQEMANIVTIINDISDRINLLSLNASIEAARAGEAGRGFAVVADEIGKLADQTSSSVKEIDALIRKSVGEISKGMSGVGDTVAVMGDIIRGVSDISGMIRDINESMQKNIASAGFVSDNALQTRGRSEEIKTASEEQRRATGEIVKGITDINQLSQVNASGAEDLLRLSRDIAAMAHDLRARIERFGEGGGAA